MNKNNIIKSSYLSRFPNLNHGFFTRNHSNSQNQNNLNFSLESSNYSQLIQNNYQIAAKTLNIKINQIIVPNQCHSNIPILIKDPVQIEQIQNSNIKADAIVTTLSNLYISVLTADCVPILIYDDTRKYIAAIHAGWQGSFSGIIENTIALMQSNDCKAENMTVAIMPSITYNFYEVKKEFYQKFISQNQKNKLFFYYKQQKIFFDLRNYIIQKLQNIAIRKIDNLSLNTYSNKNLFHSYRRSCHEATNSGRHLSFIWKRG